MAMKPGAEINLTEKLWRPTGKAEGVFYLGEKPSVVEQQKRLGDTYYKVTQKPSAVMEAMRYLRPPADDWYERFPECNGHTVVGNFQGVTDLKGMPAELKEKALKEGRPILHMFSADSLVCQNAGAQAGALVRYFVWEMVTDEIAVVTLKLKEQ